MSLFAHISKTMICLTACVTLLAAPAIAEQDEEMNEAWKDAIGDQEPILTDKQFALLNNLAFQAAVTKICDGFQLDDAKFSSGVAEATSPAPPDMNDEEADTWEAAVTMPFGTTYGLFLAEGNDEPDDFCESAKELKADAEVPNVWQ